MTHGLQFETEILVNITKQEGLHLGCTWYREMHWENIFLPVTFTPMMADIWRRKVEVQGDMGEKHTHIKYSASFSKVPVQNNNLLYVSKNMWIFR